MRERGGEEESGRGREWERKRAGNEKGKKSNERKRQGRAANRRKKTLGNANGVAAFISNFLARSKHALPPRFPNSRPDRVSKAVLVIWRKKRGFPRLTKQKREVEDDQKESLSAYPERRAHCTWIVEKTSIFSETLQRTCADPAAPNKRAAMSTVVTLQERGERAMEAEEFRRR